MFKFLSILNLISFCLAFNFENFDSDSVIHEKLEIVNFDNVWCHCWNFTEEISRNYSTECSCHGKKLLGIPDNLPEDMEKFSVSNAGIRILDNNSFVRHRNVLKDIILSQLPYLEVIEPGTFKKITNLRSIYIDDAPLIKRLPQLFLGVNSKTFLSLRIMHTGLEEMPDMTQLGDSNRILHMVDLEANNLKFLGANSIRIKVQQLVLNYNYIAYIDAHAFNGSHIAKLKLKGNRQLTKMHELAFKGLKDLQELDISGTSLESLPVQGIQGIEILRIQNTPTLKKIPSIYDFKNLRKAWLTYSFHCCAFKFPIKHDPTRHAAHISKVKEACKRVPKKLLEEYHVVRKRHISNFNNFNFDQNSTKIYNDPLRGFSRIAEVEDEDFAPDVVKEDEEGTFHEPVENPDDKIQAICGNISQRIKEVQCYPQPDALNPCEDIMGSNWLRVPVWFVVITAVLGNLAVIVVFFSNLFDINVSKFLMFNLAFADICMGIYLLLIASMDLHSMGFYFNFAYHWQIGDGCQIAGFLTVFSSQLSVFTLTIITLERWFAIRYAIYLNKRIRLGAAYKIMIFGWCYSILMASLPLAGVSNYSSTSICLPMEAQEAVDMAYLASLLLANGLAFLIIVICYTQIYFSLGTTTRRSITNNEMTIAKKMALLVFTDFACWAPIAFFGLTALAGYPLINVTKSKILLVFFYPLNSCANPYLYAILTAQYRRDFFALLYKCGVCKNTKRKTISNNTTQTNQTNPVPLLSRTNNLSDKSKSSKCVEEALV